MYENTIFILEEEKTADDYIAVLKKNNFRSVVDFTNTKDLYIASFVFMPDLVITDLAIRSKKHGIYLVKRLRKDYDIPILFISEVDYKNYTVLLELPKIIFLNKPASESVLIDAVKKLLSYT